MGKALMVQGTMSSAGKSLMVTGLCRVLAQDGYRVAPFKSQNMALNSYITADGLEMGRAQVTQAEAAGVEPSVLMNPILLKPTSDSSSQVVVMGEVAGTVPASDYYAQRSQLRTVAADAYHRLADEFEIVVIEGAGSPAEINLNEGDFVNMGMAEIADSPVLLVADIDRGGVFASIYGTVHLLEPEQRERIKGVIINKFRGDISLLEPGLRMIEERTGVPVLGVLPMLEIDIDDEDAISGRFGAADGVGLVDIAVIGFPRISNSTDFNALSRLGPVGLRYVRKASELGHPDLVILPGTKATIADLGWLRETGLAEKVLGLASAGVPVVGICGGYQMLGRLLRDPDGVEGGGTAHGLGLLPCETTFAAAKTRTRVKGRTLTLPGELAGLSGLTFAGYEIHMGKTTVDSVPTNPGPFAELRDADSPDAPTKPDGAASGLVFGCYVHGIFDGALGVGLVRWLLQRKGISPDVTGVDTEEHKQREFDRLAAALRAHLDIPAIKALLNL